MWLQVKSLLLLGKQGRGDAALHGPGTAHALSKWAKTLGDMQRTLLQKGVA